MNKMQKQVREFHHMFDVYSGTEPSIPPKDVQKLRINLLREELDEFERALNEDNLHEAIKELCDIVYVAMGAAEALGVDIEPYFDEVQRSNMSKTWPDGLPHRREDGKWLKPPTYSPANIAFVHKIVKNSLEDKKAFKEALRQRGDTYYADLIDISSISGDV